MIAVSSQYLSQSKSYIKKYHAIILASPHIKKSDTMKCPICEGQLIEQKTPYSFKGIYFGNFDAYFCTTCKEAFIREKHLLAIEDFAKKMGLWGPSILPHKDTVVINKSGTLLIGFSELFNRHQPSHYRVASIITNG